MPPELRDIPLGPEDPEECLDMANQKKQSTEAAVLSRAKNNPAHYRWQPLFELEAIERALSDLF